jgi:hypothetical protein
VKTRIAPTLSAAALAGGLTLGLGLASPASAMPPTAERTSVGQECQAARAALGADGSRVTSLDGTHPGLRCGQVVGQARAYGLAATRENDVEEPETEEPAETTPGDETDTEDETEAPDEVEETEDAEDVEDSDEVEAPDEEDSDVEDSDEQEYDEDGAWSDDGEYEEESADQDGWQSQRHGAGHGKGHGHRHGHGHGR